MDKRQLRLEARRQRDVAPPDPAGARIAAGHFLDWLSTRPPQTVALYWPRSGEFDTRPLIGRLLDTGIACCLPVMREDSLILGFAAWDGRQPLVHGPHGIQQPTGDADLRPAIVVVPLLAFDGAGHRLGYGGGYYDATLQALRAAGPLTAVGIGADSQRLAHLLPHESHDQRLDACVTPGGLVTFDA